jgi:hypothetical protein
VDDALARLEIDPRPPFELQRDAAPEHEDDVDRVRRVHARPGEVERHGKAGEGLLDLDESIVVERSRVRERPDAGLLGGIAIAKQGGWATNVWACPPMCN